MGQSLLKTPTMQVLLDTNIIIDHFNDGILSSISPNIQLAVSVITEAELLRLAGISQAEIATINNFLSITEKIIVSSSIAQRAARIGRTRKNKLPDLLIAATALEYNLALFTRNIKDFQRIPNLHIIKKLSNLQ